MSPAREQALVLSGICLAGAVFFVVLIFCSRATRFGVFVALNLLLAAALFGAQMAFGLSQWRSQIVAASTSELPVVFLISWVCLAQAGHLPAGLGGVPAEPTVRRPLLRRLVSTAPLVLLAAWVTAAIMGLAWPSPAMQAYTPASANFAIFKWAMSVPEGFYAALSASIFFATAGACPGVPILRLKNLAFSTGLACLGLIALESATVAGARVWAPDAHRRAAVEALLALEAYLAASCFIALVIGVGLRYTPAIATTLIRRLHAAWLPSLARLESVRWRAVTAGRARGVILASHRVAEAAKLQGLSLSETESALAAIQLLAVIKDPSAETDNVTVEAIRKLCEVQEEIFNDGFLAPKVNWAMHPGSLSCGSRPARPAPLHDALKAALDLGEERDEPREDRSRPLWHHLVAVGAADLGWIDAAHVQAHFGRQAEYARAAEVYNAAKEVGSLRGVMPTDRGG